jgi:hypothetical protein
MDGWSGLREVRKVDSARHFRSRNTAVLCERA